MKNNKKINKTRRQRGYAFENYIVKKFNDISGFSAKRLGSPSVQLPDVMCVNDFYKTILAIEAKSTTQRYAYVPADQIERCRDWVDMFGVYHCKYVVLAFKFGQTRQKVKGDCISRKLQYHYKIFPYKKFTPCEVRADYDGNIKIKSYDDWMDITLEDYKF